MVTLITLLISLLGYGTSADFQDLTESQLHDQIGQAQVENTDGGTAGEWDSTGVYAPAP
jgi:hypothetical protein